MSDLLKIREHLLESMCALQEAHKILCTPELTPEVRRLALTQLDKSTVITGEVRKQISVS